MMEMEVMRQVPTKIGEKVEKKRNAHWNLQQKGVMNLQQNWVINLQQKGGDESYWANLIATDLDLIHFLKHIHICMYDCKCSVISYWKVCCIRACFVMDLVQCL